MFKKFLFLAFLTVFGLGAVPLIAHTVQAQEIEEESIIYETPTLRTLSQLYWALLKFDPSDDIAVDNFLRINECDLFKDYAQNEFEWKGIREAGRDFVMTNRKNFPTHFELLQPIQFAEYELDSSQFDVWKPNKIKAVRRFEVLAEDIFHDVCGLPYGRDIPGYPKGLHMELNRPFTLDKISVDPKLAEAYIVQKQEAINATGHPPENKTELYESRDAYLIMKIRVFSFKEDVKMREYSLSKVLGVLESYEIYGDRERQTLLYSENFRRKKERSQMEMEMKKRYQERLKKQMEEKRKAAEDAKKEAAE